MPLLDEEPARPLTPRQSEAAKPATPRPSVTSAGRLKKQVPTSLALPSRATVVCHDPQQLLQTLPSRRAQQATRGSVSSTNDHIRVAVRIRPFLARDAGQRDMLSAHSDGKGLTVSLEPSTNTADGDTKGSATPQQRKSSALPQEKAYKYDYVFDSRANCARPAQQCHIYEALGDWLVTNAVAGYNGCLFAYGQTGTGKTHTLMGVPSSVIEPEDPERFGLLPRILDGIFAQVEQNQAAGKPSSLRIKYLEIYNERIRDLLVPPNMRKDNLVARYTPQLGLVINDLTESVASTRQEAQELVDFGMKMRSIAATSMNSRSSRAHTVFMFEFEQADGKGGDTLLSQVQVVDLAGREQEKTSGDDPKRLRERTFINKSLFWLKDCIHQLAKSGRGSKLPEFSFRNSRLTLLLSASLGGNSRTGMIAAVSPSRADVEETQSTLDFAARAKSIRTAATANQVNKTDIVQELQAEIVRLKQEACGDKLRERVDQLEALCEHYKRSLEIEQSRSKELAKKRWKALEELGLSSVGGEGTAITVAADQSVPYLVNLSEDPYLEGCLMYFLRGPEEVTIGSAEDNKIRLSGLGILPHHCAIQNHDDKKLVLRVAAGRTGDLPRTTVNGRRVVAEVPTELLHCDCLVLGHALACRVVVPREAKQLSREGTPKCRDDEDYWSRLSSQDEVSDMSMEHQHLRRAFEDFKRKRGNVEATRAFATQLHLAISLVEQANMITSEVRPEEHLEFQLQVLTDLGLSLSGGIGSGQPELAVVVLCDAASTATWVRGNSPPSVASVSDVPEGGWGLPTPSDAAFGAGDALSPGGDWGAGSRGASPERTDSRRGSHEDCPPSPRHTTQGSMGSTPISPRAGPVSAKRSSTGTTVEVLGNPCSPRASTLHAQFQRKISTGSTGEAPGNSCSPRQTQGDMADGGHGGTEDAPGSTRTYPALTSPRVRFRHDERPAMTSPKSSQLLQRRISNSSLLDEVEALRVRGSSALSVRRGSSGLSAEHRVVKFIWSYEKFRDRWQLMCDIYEEVQARGMKAVQRRLVEEPYNDPWKEIRAGEVEMMVLKQSQESSSQPRLRPATPGSIGDPDTAALDSLSGFEDLIRKTREILHEPSKHASDSSDLELEGLDDSNSAIFSEEDSARKRPPRWSFRVEEEEEEDGDDEAIDLDLRRPSSCHSRVEKLERQVYPSMQLLLEQWYKIGEQQLAGDAGGFHAGWLRHFAQPAGRATLPGGTLCLAEEFSLGGLQALDTDVKPLAPLAADGALQQEVVRLRQKLEESQAQVERERQHRQQTELQYKLLQAQVDSLTPLSRQPKAPQDAVERNARLDRWAEQIESKAAMLGRLNAAVTELRSCTPKTSRTPSTRSLRPEAAAGARFTPGR